MTPAAARVARRAADPSPDASRGRPRVAGRAEPVRQAPRRPPLTVLPTGYRSPRSPRSFRRRRRLVAAAGMLTGLIGVFSLVVVHVELTANQLRLVHLQQQAEGQQQRYLKLRLEVAQLESPERVVATAQQLGMVPPTTITYLTAVAGGPPAAQVTAPDTLAAHSTEVGSGAEAWATTKQTDSRR